MAAARWALLTSLSFVALLLLARRFGGALVQPLEGGRLVAVAMFAGLGAAAVRWTVHGPSQGTVLGTGYSVLGTRYAVWFGYALFAAPGIAAILLLAAVTVSGSSIVGVLTGWFLLIAAEGSTWMLALRHQPVAEAAEELESELPAGLVQQVTRIQDAAGGESIHAVLRTFVVRGDRQGVIHVAFCPPLAAPPQLTAHALDSDAEVRITQAESFGARLEVRLPAVAAEEQAVLVELLGSVKAAQSA